MRSAIGIAVLALALAACDFAASSDPAPSPPTTAPQLQPPGLGTAADGTVARVLDGDSLRIIVGEEELEVRLLGINAPEAGECGGERARNDLVSLLDGATVAVGYEERDQFGRVLGYVDAAGRDVAVAQLAAGNGIALSIDHPRSAEYFAAERAAQEASAGIWGDPARACGQVRPAPVVIDGVEFDPPGPDGAGDGESVALSNDGAAAVDVSGWTLRDESTRWRYVFPEGFALAGGATVVVHTGCGDDSAQRLNWCTGEPVWSNDGDTVLLLDAAGNIRDHLSYGPKAEG